MLSANAAMMEVNQTYPACAFIKFILRVTFFKPFMINFGVNRKLEKYTHAYFIEM